MAETNQKTSPDLEKFEEQADAAMSQAEAAQTDGSKAKAKQNIKAADLASVYDVPVKLCAVLGRTNMQVADLLALDSGAVIELDRKVGEAIDIFVNDRLIARGEVVMVEERLGVTMTEIIESGSE